VTGITIFRTSLVWVQTVPAILAKAVPAPYGFLGAYGDYASAFDACQKGTLAAGALSLPWRKPQGNYYWRYYFEGQEAGEVTGVQAWKKLVPFCRKLEIATVGPAKPAARVAFEMFYAPHGLAVVARANYRGPALGPTDVAKLAHAVRYDYRFLPGGVTAPPAGLSLDRVVDEAFAQVRKGELGNASGFAGGGEPMSVTTFLQGENAQPIAQGSDEHLLLEAVTSWSRGLSAADLATRELADAQLPVLHANAQNMVYARGRGRAIWFPRDFVGNDQPLLPCYHQNTVIASLQTQSLGAFVAWVAAQLAESNPVNPGVLERAKRAAALLKIFANGGTSNGLKITYRSASVKAQVANAKWDNAIKAVEALP
jgi:hypothetical protein